MKKTQKNDFFEIVYLSRRRRRNRIVFTKKVKGKKINVIESSVLCNVMDVNSDMHGTEKNDFLESSYQVTENQSIPVYADIQTYPCPTCGRCFNAESLVNSTKTNSVSF